MGIPTAISEAKSVGLMQVHVPTWGGVIDFTERNPFDPEVNIDVGTTILADYIKRYKDLDTALAAYEGTHNPETSEYLGKSWRCIGLAVARYANRRKSVLMQETRRTFTQ